MLFLRALPLLLLFKKVKKAARQKCIEIKENAA